MCRAWRGREADVGSRAAVGYRRHLAAGDQVRPGRLRPGRPALLAAQARSPAVHATRPDPGAGDRERGRGLRVVATPPRREARRLQRARWLDLYDLPERGAPALEPAGARGDRLRLRARWADHLHLRPEDPLEQSRLLLQGGGLPAHRAVEGWAEDAAPEAVRPGREG